MSKKTVKSRKTYSKNQWFYGVRGSYLPRTWQAWGLYVPYAFVLIRSAVWAHTGNPAIQDELFKVFPVWVAAGVVMTWIAKSKS